MSELGMGGGNEHNGGDGLVGQRNENSVLFSLDDLARVDEADGSGQASAFSFGGSGDQSGLIDLNTLAKLGASGSSGNDVEVPVVFNDVGIKRKPKALVIGLAIALILLIGGGVVGYVMYQNMKTEQAEKEEAARLEAERLAALEKEKKDLEAKLEQARLEAEAESKRREADAEAVKLAMAKQAEEAAAQEAAGSAPSGTKKSSGSSSKGSSTATEPSAPSKGSGPSPSEVRSALLSSAEKAKKCAKNGSLNVSFTLNGNGKASSVKATGGSFAGTATERCIITVVEKHDFPRFSGSPVKGVKFTYKL